MLSGSIRVDVTELVFLKNGLHRQRTKVPSSTSHPYHTCPLVHVCVSLNKHRKSVVTKLFHVEVFFTVTACSREGEWGD